MSRQFVALKAADLIQAERLGTTIRYRLNVTVAQQAMGALLNVLGTRKPDPNEEVTP